jgi:hydroxymethylpyrimidine kinase/phosphomethylpyrimidine kinase/thiamine-phosphate diphosphorylase
VLTIAGSDSGGGAGVQADLKTFASLGVFGTSALTAVTSQNTRGVHAVHAIPPEHVASQLRAVLSDLGADAAKTGMLPSAACVRAVARALREHAAPLSLVVDPVLVSTSGHALSDAPAADALRAELLPLATVLTPNLAEAAALLRVPQGELRGAAALLGAARALAALGPSYVLLKGGHVADAADGAPPSEDDALFATDVLVRASDGAAWTLRARRVASRNTHGTGCTLAAALAAALARGLPPPAAARVAKAHVAALIRASAGLPLGAGDARPMHHAALLRPTRAAPAQRAALDLRLYVITPDGAASGAGGAAALLAAVAAAVAGGATAVQVREKALPGGQLVSLVRSLVAHCRPRGIAVLVNDRLDVALAADADGVHLGQTDIPAAAARALLGPGRFLGVSAKTPAHAHAAAADGADYVGSGACFPTATKDSSVIGLAGLAAVCAAAGEAGMPVVAIGGLTRGSGRLGAAVAAGAEGGAVVGAAFGAADITAAVREMRAEVDAALAARVASEHAS